MGIRVGLERGMVLKTIDKNTPSDSLITISDRSDRVKSAESNALVGSEKIGGDKSGPETRSGIKTCNLEHTIRFSDHDFRSTRPSEVS